MSGEPTALVVSAPARAEIRVVHDAIPTLDTARFEHMQRIATVMASSSLIPDSLRKYGDEVLPPHAIVSNCFLIVNQAVRWELDPFAVAQCCSVVHGRLMFEGKLVAAVLESRLKIKLGYKFGKWDAARQATDLSAEGQGDQLAVRIFDKNDEERFVDGYVGGWKTTGTNNPWQPANFRRQLRYRGAREWARVHEAAVMLGVYADDEFDEPRKDERTGKAAKVTAVTAELAAPAIFNGNVPHADVPASNALAADTPKAEAPAQSDVFPGDLPSPSEKQQSLFGDQPQREQSHDEDGVLDDLDVIMRDIIARLNSAAGNTVALNDVVNETKADFEVLDPQRRNNVQAALEAARNTKKKVA